MKKETVKKVVEGVGAFGAGGLAAIPYSIVDAAVKGHWLLIKAPVLIASWALHMGLYAEYIRPVLDDVVDAIMDDDPVETVTE